MSAKKKDGVDLTYLGDKKLEKGRSRLLEESAAWRGKPRAEKQGEAPRKPPKREQPKREQGRRGADKVSWRKRVGGLVALALIGGVGLFQFVSAVLALVLGDGIATLDVQDTAGLKDVLFGGNPWLVHCVSNATRHQRLPDVLTESARSLRKGHGVRVGVLGCWDATASGRSVAQRFGLPRSPPLTFLVVNGNKPRVVKLVGVSKREDLEKKLKPALKTEIRKIDTLKKWSSLCTSRRACVVVGHKQSAQRETATGLLRPLQEAHRAVRIVTLDTAFWSLKLDAALLAARPARAKGGGADVLCLARDEGPGNATYRGAFLAGHDSSSASAFLEACERRRDLLEFKGAPKIKARPSKPRPQAPAPQPRPPAEPQRPKAESQRPRAGARTNVDSVGSREKLESQDEALFEAVEEDEGAEGEAPTEEAEDAEDPEDEVEL